MKRLYLAISLILVVLLLSSCTSKAVKPSITVTNEEKLTSGIKGSNYIELSKVNDDIWIHTSYENYNGSMTPSNGMLINTSKGFVLIDTPWNNEQTKELVKLIKEKFNQDITLAIITHAHEDRIGGIDTLLENKIEVRSTELTAELAKANGYKMPKPELDANPNIKIGDLDIEVFYPGEGHSKDNITVWLPKYKILFGGCLIKSLESKDMGSTVDASIAQWPDSVRKVKEKYPVAQLVVPGHGKWGGTQLIDHTLKLLSGSTK